MVEVVSARIVSDKLQEKPCDGVVADVSQYHFPLKGLVLSQPHQERNGSEYDCGLVQLGRMNAGMEWNPGQLMGNFRGKRYAERQMGRRAPTTTCKKTSDAAEALCQGQPGRNAIGGLPSR